MTVMFVAQPASSSPVAGVYVAWCLLGWLRVGCYLPVDAIWFLISACHDTTSLVVVPQVAVASCFIERKSKSMIAAKNRLICKCIFDLNKLNE
jgi:hypothetical protein